MTTPRAPLAAAVTSAAWRRAIVPLALVGAVAFVLLAWLGQSDLGSLPSLVTGLIAAPVVMFGTLLLLRTLGPRSEPAAGHHEPDVWAPVIAVGGVVVMLVFVFLASDMWRLGFKTMAAIELVGAAVALLAPLGLLRSREARPRGPPAAPTGASLVLAVGTGSVGFLGLAWFAWRAGVTAAAVAGLAGALIVVVGLLRWQHVGRRGDGTEQDRSSA